MMPTIIPKNTTYGVFFDTSTIVYKSASLVASSLGGMKTIYESEVIQTTVTMTQKYILNCSYQECFEAHPLGPHSVPWLYVPPFFPGVELLLPAQFSYQL